MSTTSFDVNYSFPELVSKYLKWAESQRHNTLVAKTQELYEAIQGASWNSPWSVYKSIPQERLYRLFVDQNRWPKEGAAETPDVFENEEGYMSGMMSAFIRVMGDQCPLSAELLKQYHDEAVGRVRTQRGESIEGSYRKTRSPDERSIERFNLKWGETISESGFRELQAKYSTDSAGYFVPVEDSEPQSIFYLAGMVNPKRTVTRELSIQLQSPNIPISELVDRLIQMYNLRPNQTEKDKVRAMIQLVQDLDQIHPFYDGNIRTFAVLLLNRLLISERMDPCCFTDPNCIDCLSVEELVDKLREGQEHFRSLQKCVLGGS